MTAFEESAGPVPTGATTTTAQPASSRLVRRDGLIHAMRSVTDDVPLILVVAPAGYGKTTALRQWADEDPRPFVFVSLDHTDNDPVRLLRHIGAALRPVTPLEESSWRAMAAAAVSPLPLVRRLVESIGAAGQPPVVVLDDLHRVNSRRAANVIVALVKGAPAGCPIVVGSRWRPDWRLLHVRGPGHHVEFGTADLTLTPTEAGAVLAEAGIDPSAATVQAFLRRTQGWPAATDLLARSLRGNADVVAAVNDSACSERLIGFVRDEILADESPETVRFLLRTAALDQMSAPLCDAALQKTGSAAWLRKLESRNMFLAAERRRVGWYRYHPLFAEMLVSELRRREPGEDRSVRGRAAGWYADHNMPEQAIVHAFAAEDNDLVARLVLRYAQPISNRCNLTVVRRWLEATDHQILHEHASLAVTAAWVWALSGYATRARQCLLTAESGVDGSPSQGTASLTSATAMVRAALAPLGVERMLHDAQTAFDLEPPESTWSPVAALMLGTAQLLNGQATAASTTLELAVSLSRQSQPAISAFALAQLSLHAAEQDEWATAGALADESWTVLNLGPLRNGIPALATYLARARVAAHEGDDEAAWRDVGVALRLHSRPSPNAFPWFAAQSAITLGRVFVDLADPMAARRKSQEARRQLNRLLTDGVLRQQQERLVEVIGQKVDPPRGLGAMTLTLTLTEAELRVLQLLPTHLSIAEIAEELSVSRNTVKSQVASVYHKLNSSSRTAAVQRGREVGLLDA